MQNSLFYFKEKLTIRNLTVISMLIAVSVALRLVIIPIGSIVQVSFGFLAIALISSMYGPIIGGLAAGISDIIGSVLIPTGVYFPGFTLSAILGGVIYGIFLYKNKGSFLRIVIAMLLVGIIVNIILNSLWLSLMYGYGFIGLLPARILKNILTITLNSTLYYLLYKLIGKRIERFL